MEKERGNFIETLDSYTVIDLEMTGLSAKRDKVIEIGAVRVRNRQVVDTYGTLVNAKCEIPQKVRELTGITDEMVADGMDENEAMQKLLDFIGEDILVGHNIRYDYSFIKQWAVNKRIPLELYACDTLQIARMLLAPDLSKKLDDLCEYFHIERETAHRALDDAIQTQQIYECLKELENSKHELFKPKLLTYKAKRQTPATVRQKKRLKEYMEFYHITDNICWETLTRSDASRLQDQYYAAYGNYASYCRQKEQADN